MAEISGLAVKTLPIFIKDNFGEEGLQRWKNELDPDVRELFDNPIVITDWFEINKFIVIPTKLVCDLFYNGDEKAAWTFGRFSADFGLKGVLKLFVKMGSVSVFVNRAATSIPHYYRPLIMEVILQEKKRTRIILKDFPDIHRLIEYRIAGWMERALEISGCKNVDLKIPKSIIDGDDVTEFDISWD
jgi:hypothetical protein